MLPNCFWSIVILTAVILPTTAQENQAPKKKLPEVEARAVLYGAQHFPYQVVITPDNKTIISTCGGFGGVRFWDVATKKERAKALDHTGRGVHSLSLSQDGKTVATGGFNDLRIVLRDATTGKVKKVLTGHEERIIAVHFMPDGKRLLSASMAGDIRIWDVQSGKNVGALFGRIRNLQRVDLSSDGRTLALLPGTREASGNLWDVEKDKAGPALEGLTDIHGGCPIRFTPDGKMVAIASGGNKPRVMLWDVSRGKQVSSIPLHTSNTYTLAFSPDGKLLATAHDNFDHIRLWELSSGKPLASFVGHNTMIEALSFSRDGKLLISGSRDERIRIWDVPSPGASGK